MFPRHCKEMQMQHKPTSAHTAFPGERSAPGQQARYDSAYTITGDALAHTSPWVWRTTTTHDRSWHTIWDIWPTTCDRTWHTIDDVWPTTYDRTRHTIDDIWPTTHVRTWHTNTTYDPAFTDTLCRKRPAAPKVRNCRVLSRRRLTRQGKFGMLFTWPRGEGNATGQREFLSRIQRSAEQKSETFCNIVWWNLTRVDIRL